MILSDLFSVEFCRLFLSSSTGNEIISIFLGSNVQDSSMSIMEKGAYHTTVVQRGVISLVISEIELTSVLDTLKYIMKSPSNIFNSVNYLCINFAMQISIRTLLYQKWLWKMAYFLCLQNARAGKSSIMKIIPQEPHNTHLLKSLEKMLWVRSKKVISILVIRKFVKKL